MTGQQVTLGPEVDPAGGGCEDLDGEQRGGRQVGVGEVRDARDEHVGLHLGVEVETDRERRDEDLEVLRAGVSEEHGE